MKKEVTCCDSCEKILEHGGLRIATPTQTEETIDLCVECLTEVLPEFSERTGRESLSVTIPEEDFLLLRGDDSEDGDDDDPIGTPETMIA